MNRNIKELFEQIIAFIGQNTNFYGELKEADMCIVATFEEYTGLKLFTGKTWEDIYSNTDIMAYFRQLLTDNF